MRNGKTCSICLTVKRVSATKIPPHTVSMIARERGYFEKMVNIVKSKTA